MLAVEESEHGPALEAYTCPPGGRAEIVKSDRKIHAKVPNLDHRCNSGAHSHQTV